MSMKTNSSKLAHLLRLCFAAGIVSLSGAAIADCNFDHSICTQPGLKHDLPSACDMNPDTPICHDGNSGNPNDNGGRPISLEDALAGGVQILHASNNLIRAGCASAYSVRQASAKADILAWWPTYAGPIDGGIVIATVRYSSGEREIWNIYHGKFTNSGDPYRDPSLTFESIGTNATRGIGYMGLALPYDISQAGVWGPPVTKWGAPYLLCE